MNCQPASAGIFAFKAIAVGALVLVSVDGDKCPRSTLQVALSVINTRVFWHDEEGLDERELLGSPLAFDM